MNNPWSGNPSFQIKAPTQEEYTVQVLEQAFKGPVFRRIVIIMILILSGVFYANKTVGTAFLGVAFVVFIFTYLIMKATKSLVNRKVKKAGLVSDRYIVVDSGKVYFPEHLDYVNFNKQNKPTIENGYFFLEVNQIKDFELIPISKHTKQHFRISYSDGTSNKIIHVLATLLKEDIKSFRDALRDSYQIVPGEESPFSEFAEQQRKKKRAISVGFILGAFLCIPVITILFVMYPPVLFWSSIIQYIIYGASIGILVDLILKKLIFANILDSRFGKSMPIVFYFGFFCAIGFTMSAIINILGTKEIIEHETAVKRKGTRVHKGKRRYYVYVDLNKVDKKGFYYVFPEETRLKVRSDYYKFIYPEKTLYKVFINKGLLNIPHIDHYQVQKNSQLVEGKTNKDLFRLEITKGSPYFNVEKYEVSQWLPKAESFERANKVKIEKWPNGGTRSWEPVLNLKKHGTARYYHRNGKKYALITWIHGKKHGAYTTWKDNGEIEARYSYKNGKLHGRIEWYDNQGEVSQVRYYKNGKLIP